ncbi:FAD-dependent oxidoreductase [Falsiroseomonas bella]|uniref:FAD-dependent oxidoreductase n=1 Tax=Falsiroseomonas bella TaxID=2184016 RepID=A0A317FGX6_9PROT|nr:FAD-dependent oxidoreductase [Falsiroseomonas bella]PWS37612.1 FAD-dependent oxidoreductase [Falsiroseomonas bella]
MNRAIVIGGGLHGLSTALHLARMPGWQVTVLERRHVGRHSSGVNAGGVRRLGRDLREIALSMVAWEMWSNISALVGDDCGFQPGGQVKVAENAAELGKLEARAAQVRALGWTHEEVVDQAEVRRLLPAIAPHVVGALVCHGDGSADPMRTVMAFRRAAQEAGATIIEGSGVTAIERSGAGTLRVVTEEGTHEAERVANCAGAWATRIARMAGEEIPCGVKASMMIVTERLPHFCTPTVGPTGRALSFKQTVAGTVVIGGGHQGLNDPERETSTVLFGNLAHAARIAAELFPCVKGARIMRTWTGTEARTPDEIPVIGESRTMPGLFHSFGYSGHGFQLSPAAGAAVAELIARGATNLPVAPFTQRRFDA